MNRALTKPFLNLFFILFLGFSNSAQSDVLSCFKFYTPNAAIYLISGASLSDLVRFRNEVFEVVVPYRHMDRIALRYEAVSRWEDVENLYRGVALSDRILVRSYMNRYMKDYERVAGYFKIYAQTHQLEIENRFKDIQSLRNKIIDRSKEYSDNGKIFSFEDIDDFIGIRLIVPKHSSLIDSQFTSQALEGSILVKDFEEKFGISEFGKVVNVDIRGGASDQAKERFYRATHVTLKMDSGAPVEVQLMTKSIATWHHWDHPTVYKSKSTDEKYLGGLRKYSRFWVKLIRVMENQNRSPRKAWPELLKLTHEYGLSSNDLPYASALKAGWMLDLDAKLAVKFGILNTDRFLGDESLTPISDQQRLFAEFASPWP